MDNWKWRNGPIDGRSAVVFDVDGVLADAGGRQHFVRDNDWESFFQACGGDALINETVRLIDCLDPTLAVVLLTARPLRVQPQTMGWLKRHGFNWDLLVMRDFGDYTASAQFKDRSISELTEYGFDLRLAFEDDPRNVMLFGSRGIPCVYIHSGYYD